MVTNVKMVSKDLELAKKSYANYVSKIEREVSCLRDDIQLTRSKQYAISKDLDNAKNEVDRFKLILRG